MKLAEAKEWQKDALALLSPPRPLTEGVQSPGDLLAISRRSPDDLLAQVRREIANGDGYAARLVGHNGVTLVEPLKPPIDFSFDAALGPSRYRDHAGGDA